MDSGILLVLIFVGVTFVPLLTAMYDSARLGPDDGSLSWGWSHPLLSLVCLAAVGFAITAFFIDDDVWTSKIEFLSVVLLLVGSGAIAVYFLAEYFLVHGTYDEEGIAFYTPWTGAKEEKWRDLRSVEYRNQLNWYALKFQSGKVIHLSYLLVGHRRVLEKLEHMGFEWD